MIANFNNLMKHRPVVVKSIEYLGLSYLVLGLTVAYGWSCKDLDIQSLNDRSYEKFWEPLIIIYTLANLVTFITVLFRKYRNRLLQTNSIEYYTLRLQPGNKIIVYFIVLPLFFLSVVYMLMVCIRSFAVIQCEGQFSFCIPIGILAILVSVMIFIFDRGGHDEPRDVEVRRTLVMFIIIGVFNVLAINVSLQHTVIFEKESINSSYHDLFKWNKTCIRSNHISNKFDEILLKCQDYLRPMLILFCVCSIAYLIQLTANLKDSYNSHILDALVENELLEDQDGDEEKDNEELAQSNKLPHNPSFRLPSLSLILCILFLSLSFLAFILVLSLADNNTHKKIGNIVYYSLSLTMYSLGTALSVVHIHEVMRWPIDRTPRNKAIDLCLIWIGAAGQMLTMISNVTEAVDTLVYGSPLESENGVLLAQCVTLIVASCALVVQTYFQTVLISISLERRWTQPEIDSWAETLCPAVGMMGLNIGLLLLSSADLDSNILRLHSHHFFVQLFVGGLHSIGETLSTLQRLHASLYFANMIFYTHN